MNEVAVIFNIVLTTLFVCFSSVFISFIIGLPLGYLLRRKSLKHKRIIIRFFWTFSSLPPVLAGLLTYTLLSRKGPFGFLGLLFSKNAIIIAQVILIVPVIVFYSYSLLKDINICIDNLEFIGIKGLKKIIHLFNEFKTQIIYIIVLAFSEAISEVGAAMIVGGNIEGSTRIITTAIVFEISKGNFSTALELGFILLFISFLINTTLQYLQGDNID